MKVKHSATSYDIFTCPKKNRGEPVFPYKFEEMKKEREAMLNEGGQPNGK